MEHKYLQNAMDMITCHVCNNQRQRFSNEEMYDTIYIYIHTYMYIYNVYLYIYIYIHTYMYIYNVYLYIYTYIYMYIYMYTNQWKILFYHHTVFVEQLQQ